MSSEIQFGHIDRPIPVNTNGTSPGSRPVRIDGSASPSRLRHRDRQRFLVWARRAPHAPREATAARRPPPRATLVRAAEFPDPRPRTRSSTRVRVRDPPQAPASRRRSSRVRLNQAERRSTARHRWSAVGPSSVQRAQTVKLAEDRSGDLVVRLYESAGARASTRVQLDAALGGGEVSVVDLLERPFPRGCPGLPLRARAHRGRRRPLRQHRRPGRCRERMAGRRRGGRRRGADLPPLRDQDPAHHPPRLSLRERAAALRCCGRGGRRGRASRPSPRASARSGPWPARRGRGGSGHPGARPRRRRPASLPDVPPWAGPATPR